MIAFDQVRCPHCDMYMHNTFPAAPTGVPQQGSQPGSQQGMFQRLKKTASQALRSTALVSWAMGDWRRLFHFPPRFANVLARGVETAGLISVINRTVGLGLPLALTLLKIAQDFVHHTDAHGRNTRASSPSRAVLLTALSGAAANLPTAHSAADMMKTIFRVIAGLWLSAAAGEEIGISSSSNDLTYDPLDPPPSIHTIIAANVLTGGISWFLNRENGASAGPFALLVVYTLMSNTIAYSEHISPIDA